MKGLFNQEIRTIISTFKLNLEDDIETVDVKNAFDTLLNEISNKKINKNNKK